MNSSDDDPYYNPKPYVPATLSEVYDLLGGMVLGAPTFVDKGGDFPDRTIDTEFAMLIAGLGRVRNKLGEEEHDRLVAVATKAKTLFAADPNRLTGETNAGYELLFEIEDIIQVARRRRVAAKLPDHEGEITGD